MKHTITEIKKMTTDALAKQEEERKERIHNFIENALEPNIVNNAKAGKRQLGYVVTGLNPDLVASVMEILREEGYTVEKREPSIIIQW